MAEVGLLHQQGVIVMVGMHTFAIISIQPLLKVFFCFLHRTVLALGGGGGGRGRGERRGGRSYPASGGFIDSVRLLYLLNPGSVLRSDLIFNVIFFRKCHLFF